MVASTSASLLPNQDDARHSSDRRSLESYRVSPLSLREAAIPGDSSDYAAVRQLDDYYPERDGKSTDVLATNSTPTPTVQRKVRGKRLLSFGWWWEVYAILVAIASTAAMVAVLLSVDGKLISSWSLFVQPATLVAILSAVAKSALLVPIAVCIGQLKWSYFEKPRELGHMQVFDDASRGPWGALNFLWKTRGTALLASIGALATVLLPTFEPFSQQAIQFVSRNEVLGNGTGNFSIAQSMSDRSFLGGAVLIADVRLTFTIAMMAAMTGRPSVYESNMYSGGSEAHFENFTTLGACTACSSEKVQINTEFGCTYYTYSNTTSGASEREQYTELQPFKEAVTKGLNQTLDRYGMDCSREKEGFPTFAINLEIPAKKSNTSLLQGMGVPQASSGSKDLSKDAVFGNTYVAQLIEGHYETPFIGNSIRFCSSGYGRDFGGNNGDFDTINTFTCLSTLIGLGDYKNLDTFGSFSGNLTWCRVSLCAQEYQGVVLFQNGTLQVGSVTQKPLRKIGQDAINDTKAVIDGEQVSAQFEVGPKSMSYLSQMLETVLYSKDFGEFLIQVTGSAGGNWQTVFERVGEVATQYIRSTANSDAGGVRGKVFGVQSFFRVRWEWLIMPFIMILVSLGFFIGTAIYSSRKSYLFKNSILATVLYGLDGWNPVEGGPLFKDRTTDGDLGREAIGVKAILINNEDGSHNFVQENPR